MATTESTAAAAATAAASADAVFARHAVGDVRAMRERIAADVERKDRDLRAMLSARYGDLLLAANAVSDMRDVAQDANAMLATLVADLALDTPSQGTSERILSMAGSTSEPSNTKLTAVAVSVVGPTVPGGPHEYVASPVTHHDTMDVETDNDTHHPAFYATAALIKLVADTPEHIYRLLETSSLLHAAIVAIVFSHVYDRLRKTPFPSPSSTHMVIDRFPFLNHQHAVALQAVSLASATARASLRQHDLSPRKLHDAVVASVLLSEVVPAKPTEKHEDLSPLGCLRMYLRAAYQSLAAFSFASFTEESMHFRVVPLTLCADDYCTLVSGGRTDPQDRTTVMHSERAVYICSVILRIARVFRNTLAVFTKCPELQEVEGSLDSIPGPKNICLQFKDVGDVHHDGATVSLPLSKVLEDDSESLALYKDLPDDIKTYQCKLPKLVIMRKGLEGSTNDLTPMHEMMSSWYSSLYALFEKAFGEAVGSITEASKLRELHDDIFGFYNLFGPYLDKLSIATTGKPFSFYKVDTAYSLSYGSATEVYPPISVADGLVGQCYRKQGLRILEDLVAKPVNLSLEELLKIVDNLDTLKSAESLQLKDGDTRRDNNSRAAAKNAALEGYGLMNHVWTTSVIKQISRVSAAQQQSVLSKTTLYVESQPKPILDFTTTIVDLMDDAISNSALLFKKTKTRNGEDTKPSEARTVIPHELSAMLPRAYEKIHEKLESLISSTEELLPTLQQSLISSSSVPNLVRDGIDHLLPWRLIVIGGIAQKAAVLSKSQRNLIESSKNDDKESTLKLQAVEEKLVGLHHKSFELFTNSRVDCVCSVARAFKNDVGRKAEASGHVALGRSELAQLLSSLTQLPFWVEPAVWSLLARAVNEKRSEIIDIFGEGSYLSLEDDVTGRKSSEGLAKSIPMGPRFGLLSSAALPAL